MSEKAAASPLAAVLPPAVILVYGPSGAGKTTDTGYSFPCGRFLAVRGALRSIETTCGYSPSWIEIDNIDAATEHIKKIKPGEVDAIIVDDFSYMAEKTTSLYEAKFSGFKLWEKIRESTLRFREASRYANCHVILNAWEQGPKLKEDGTRIRGGPALSGKLPEQLPAMCDMVLRCGQDTMRKPHAGVYRCHLSIDYVMKDRNDVVNRIDPAPMNLAEIMRAAGYTVRRHPDLTWQEAMVDRIASEIGVAPTAQMNTIVNTYFRQLQDAGTNQNIARWTIRDAVDRAVIKRALATKNNDFFA